MPFESRFTNEPETSAAELVWADRIRAGDVDAFEALYRKYWQPLYAFAFRYVRSKEDAEEVAQEVFFRIWRGRAQWIPAGAVRNYLYLAVRNAGRDPGGPWGLGPPGPPGGAGGDGAPRRAPAGAGGGEKAPPRGAIALRPPPGAARPPVGPPDPGGGAPRPRRARLPGQLHQPVQ